MPVSFQFNKTALQQLERGLKVRIAALPILKAKEAALRLEVKKAKDACEALNMEMNSLKGRAENVGVLWQEMPPLLRIKEVETREENIAGIKAKEVLSVKFDEKNFAMFNNPYWIKHGLELLKQIITLRARMEAAKAKAETLEYARKKTTQKVNLYEKVQVPAYEEAMLKIKRFLEDEENLGKSAQKILKNKKAPIQEILWS